MSSDESFECGCFPVSFSTEYGIMDFFGIFFSIFGGCHMLWSLKFLSLVGIFLLSIGKFLLHNTNIYCLQCVWLEGTKRGGIFFYSFGLKIWRGHEGAKICPFLFLSFLQYWEDFKG